MLFTTVDFYIFFSALLVVFYITPKKYRWVVLLTASLFFCWSFNALLSLHIVAAAMLAWAAGQIMSRSLQEEKESVALVDKSLKEERKAIRAKYKRQRRICMGVSVVLLTASLLLFKFYNPIISLLNAKGSSFAKIAVPVGISFYTLQIVSYVIDVYNQNQEAESNPLRFLLFAAWFPLLLQGPIHRYEKLAPELRCEKAFCYEDFVAGFARVLGGFLKKLIIADRLSVLTTTLFANYIEYTGVAVAFAGLAYTVQLYADFSGGIDMAIGLSQMLGISLTENFRRPYFSRSVSEYWRRWHATLGAFFKDYVFYPLTLSRAFTVLGKKLRKINSEMGKRVPALLSMAMLWLCSAVWHGEGAQYLLWGLFHWCIVTFDTFTEVKVEKMISNCNKVLRGVIAVFQTVGTFLLVTLGELIFRAEGLSAALHMVKSLTGSWDIRYFSSVLLPSLGLDAADLGVVWVTVTILFLFELLQERGYCVDFSSRIARMPLVCRWSLLLGAIAVLLIFGVYGRGYDPTPFLYFQF